MNEIKNKIKEEKEHEENLSVDEVLNRILSNEIIRARGNLLFHSNKENFFSKVNYIIKITETKYGFMLKKEKVLFLTFLTYICIDLKSFLPEWNLSNFLDKKDITEVFDKLISAIKKIEKDYPVISSKVLGIFRANTISRLKAEGLINKKDLNSEVTVIAGKNLINYI